METDKDMAMDTGKDRERDINGNKDRKKNEVHEHVLRRCTHEHVQFCTYKFASLTNNKAFKSGMCTSPLCFQCDEIETMEHLLYLCPNYAEKVWSEFGHLLTQTITQFSNEYTARIELTPKEIVFNKPHPAIMLRISDPLVRHSSVHANSPHYLNIRVLCKIKLPFPFSQLSLTLLYRLFRKYD